MEPQTTCLAALGNFTWTGKKWWGSFGLLGIPSCPTVLLPKVNNCPFAKDKKIVIKINSICEVINVIMIFC